MQLDTYWDFQKYLAASMQDPNFCWNQRQGNFKHPVRYLLCLSKLQLLTPNSSNTDLQAGAEFTTPQTEAWHKCNQAEGIRAHNYISVASAAQLSAKGRETRAARQAGHG